MSFEGLFCLLFQVHDTAFNAQASACQTHRAMYDGLVGDGSNIDGDASVMVSTNLLCFVWRRWVRRNQRMTIGQHLEYLHIQVGLYL